MVYSVRLQCGRMLARESSVEADLISSVPESGTAAAHGFAREVCHLLIVRNTNSHLKSFNYRNIIFFI